ncbi:MAG: cytochrome b/b6 domain-containing protein [Candidatus Eremiobacteraeota bacterium]|nr:cytochrome b/b6 domain-containing protein [Candidatus Eremiobacteraeota bacterium]
MFFIAFLALVSSGLEIFNAAPYLDASDKSNPAKRVLSVDGEAQSRTGLTTLFGHGVPTTGWLGYTDDGMGGREVRAFPGWITIPPYQDLADGRRWHLFFSWIMVLCGGAYILVGLLGGNLGQLVLRRQDLGKLIPYQLYYLRLRKDPPPHGTYNPLQKLAYTIVLFVFAPLIVLTGLALSPGIDAIAGPLTSAFGGRQFARLWHFAIMLMIIGFLFTHVTLVASTGVLNNLRSMLTGWFRLGEHDGTGI